MFQRYATVGITIVFATCQIDISRGVTSLHGEPVRASWMASQQGRLRDDMRISSFELSKKVECGLIKLQIDFLLDRRVTCNNEMLYHLQIPKGPHH